MLIMIFSPMVFIIIIGIAYFLSTRLSIPIIRMANITKKVASGDLKSCIIVNRKDEIGYLGNSFNDMTSRLEQSRKQLQDYAYNLEEKTRELTIKNPTAGSCRRNR